MPITSEDIEDRAEVARDSVMFYQAKHNADDCNLTAAKDLITNLLHYANEEGMNDPRAFLDSALMNYEAEQSEAEDYAECGQCEGDGTIYGGLSGNGEDEECPTCDGQGIIEKKA